MDKYCPKCKNYKDHSLFKKSKSTKDGLYGWCKNCTSTRDKEYRLKNLELYKTKAREYYWKHRDQRIAYLKMYYRNAYTENPNYGKNQHLKNRYGITHEEFNSLYEKQEGNCASCGYWYPINGSRKGYNNLVVDHDHTTGLVRALICHRCNLSIGLLEEDVIRIRKLADYLEKYKKELVLNAA